MPCPGRKLRFHEADAVKVATVVSELARNILQYASHGSLEILVLSFPRLGLRIVANDRGPGIADLEQVLSGKYRSRSGLGLGLRGAKNMMDKFEVQTKVGEGTTVVATKFA